MDLFMLFDEPLVMILLFFYATLPPSFYRLKFKLKVEVQFDCTGALSDVSERLRYKSAKVQRNDSTENINTYALKERDN